MAKANEILVKTYAELERFATAFAEGNINLLILVGDGGLQKSRTLQESVPSGSCWIQGNASPFGIYLKLYEFKDRLVVIDDVDSLSRNKDGINLLKCLCQTEPERTVAWLSATRQLPQDKVPREFVTSSQVCIIANQWGSTRSKNLAAVEDRGHVIRFAPTPEEVHRRTGEWFDDPEIYAWLGSQLHRIEAPSMRIYFRAKELKSAGLDWKQLTPLLPDNPRRALAVQLLRDENFATQEQRVRAFIERGGGCRATFFNYVTQLRGGSSTAAKHT